MNTSKLSKSGLMGLGLTASLALMATAPAALAAAASTGGSQKVELIVVLKDSADSATTEADVVKATGGSVHQRYSHALKGFAVNVPAQAAAAIAARPDVAFVEESRRVTVAGQQIPTGIQRVYASSNSAIGINGVDDTRVNVDVAVLDTGIDLQHPDLNVVGGVNCVNSSATCVAGGDDDHYHGTHVAGILAAKDNGDGVVGVAPGARLWAVKVLDNTSWGTTAQILAGIDWVAANAATIEVANMSIVGTGYFQSWDVAIQNAVNAGVAFAVAAGNNSADASGYSPGGFSNVLSVSAEADFDGLPGGLGSSSCFADVDDTNADFSNYGNQVDIAAPGVCITSTYPIEQGSIGSMSGTSMASPHVAGALGLLASARNPNNATDVNALYSAVKSAGNFNWNDLSPDGIKEPLLDVSTFRPVLVSTAVTFTSSAAKVNKNTWRGTITVTAAAGTTVTGTWSSGTTGGCTVATGATSCSFSTTTSTKVTSLTWTSSTGAVVRIARP